MRGTVISEISSFATSVGEPVDWSDRDGNNSSRLGKYDCRCPEPRARSAVTEGGMGRWRK